MFVQQAGNPCKIIREITDDDKPYYYKKRRFDDEVWQKINENVKRSK